MRETTPAQTSRLGLRASLQMAWKRYDSEKPARRRRSNQENIRVLLCGGLDRQEEHPAPAVDAGLLWRGNAKQAPVHGGLHMSVDGGIWPGRDGHPSMRRVLSAGVPSVLYRTTSAADEGSDQNVPARISSPHRRRESPARQIDCSQSLPYFAGFRGVETRMSPNCRRH
jgi:hypothetical protein